MTPIPFAEANLTVAENQPEYIPLPAHLEKDAPEGTLTFCWKLSWRERLQLLLSGKIWHQVLTFRTSLQPQMLLTKKPHLPS